MNALRWGYVPDRPEKRRQERSHILLGAAPSLPSEASKEAFEGPILDQGATSSCGGHGTVQMLAMAFGSIGKPLPWVASPRSIYALARCIERKPDNTGELPPLTDSGIEPADVMSAIRAWGVQPIEAPTSDGRFSDVEPSNVNTNPSFADLEICGRLLVFGEYRIEESRTSFMQQLCAAIARPGVGVGVGCFVDSAVESWTPDQAPLDTVDMSDPRGAGHWFALSGYKLQTDGSYVFRCVNSWGVGYGDKGHFLVTNRWLQTCVIDAYAIDASAENA